MLMPTWVLCTSYCSGWILLVESVGYGCLGIFLRGRHLVCQSGVWKKQSGGWINLALTDASLFDPRCSYIMNGARASFVDSTQIMSVQNSISGPTTATWQAIYSSSKSVTYWAQDNYSNNLYYGGAATSSISYSCP